MAEKGRLYGVGLGPGDPELITLKALKAIEKAHVVACHQAQGKKSRAYNIARQFIRPDHILLPLIYPLTKELPSEGEAYQSALSDFYDRISGQISEFLDRGQQVSVLVAGDPLLYSSFLPLYQRLGKKYETVIIPGVTSAAGAAAALSLPLCHGNQSFTILSALLPEDMLRQRLQTGDTFAILKLGSRQFDKIRRCLHDTGRAKHAFYVERATETDQKTIAIDEVNAENVPYFSLILVGA